MSRITERLDRINKYTRQRQSRRPEVQWKILRGLLTLGLVTSMCLFTFLVGYQMNGEQVTPRTVGHTISGNTPQDDAVEKRYWVDGYNIEFLNESSPTIQGLDGYTYGRGSDDIYIRAGNSPRRIYETCVHEKMHTKGVPEKYHDFIYRHQDRIVDDTCLELLYLMKGDERRVMGVRLQ